VGALPNIVDFDDPSYDPFEDAEVSFGTELNPFAPLAELRKKGPVHEIDYKILLGQAKPVTTPDAMKVFLVVGYDAVVEVFEHPEIFSNRIFELTLGLGFGQSLTVMDAPNHSRYRRIFQKAFLPNVVAKWGETLVGPVVDDLLDKFGHRGEADLVQEFTKHYPFGVIFRMLQLPRQDEEVFHKLAHALVNFYRGTDKVVEASRKLGDYLANMLADRRAHPGQDLVTTLVEAEVDGEKLPDEVIISFLRQLMNAGGDTTFRSTSTLLAMLLMNPDQLAAVQADRSLVPKAIDEALRWDTPVLMSYRRTSAETTLCGVRIPKGAMVQMSQGAANRDPAHFPDPDRFDIFRENHTRPLRFGLGPHICIGQHLARLEMTRAINILLDRLHNLRLDPDKPVPEIRGSELRSPKHIYARFDPIP